jgi:RNA polymerase sigma factor (sigma-70 family)
MSPPPAEQFAARVFMGPALRAQPDRRLVDLVRDGYDAAFEEIVRRYRRPLDRFAAAIVGGHSEDVTQDAFSKALLALRGSQAEIELRPWLYRIVRNTALNDLRGRGPAVAGLSETLPGGRSAAAEVEAREELRDLMERLGALPEPQRAALVMRELEGLSHEEIAAALGVSGGAARQAIYRARAALREGFGLLLPLPVLRALAEHGDGASGAIAAGAGASSAGGVALGGLGGGALKVGMATVLIAGTVGAGVAVQDHRGDRGPEAAEAAPLVGAKHEGARGSEPSTSSPPASRDGSGHAGNGREQEDRGGQDGPGRSAGSLGNGESSGSWHTDRGSHSGGSGHSGEEAGHSGGGSSGPSPSSGPGSGSGDRHGGSSGSDDSSGSGSGEDSSGGGGSGGSGSSGGDGSVSGSGDSSGPGSGEIESEPVPIAEPTLSESGESGEGGGSGSGPGSEGSGESSGGSSGGDDFSSGGTSGLDGSPSGA